MARNKNNVKNPSQLLSNANLISDSIVPLKNSPLIVEGMSLNSPDAYLNINNANLRVFGNVHTNQVHLGNMTVRPSYGLSTVTDVSNTTPDTIQFTNTHTAFTTTGNVTVGKDLTVSGNVEVGTANLFVDTVNSRIGVGTTEPSGQLELAGDERIQEYPPGPLTNYETHIPGYGVFKVYASSGWGNWVFKPWGAFTKDTNVWISANPTYNVGLAGNGNDDGTAMSIDTFNGINGSWLKLKLPYTINLKRFKIQGRYSSNERFVDATIYASTDDNNWDQIRSIQMPTSYDYETGVSFDTPNTSEYYDHFLIHITRLQTGTGQVPYANIGEWRLFGTPGPTTLDKGSLTLGRSLDVPRISRYDVDTETPRPEKLVVDFDTTVNTSPTDISGRGNHGTFNGTNMKYSAADKAFVFNGTDDYIGGQISTDGGDFIHSFSFWVKYNVIAREEYAFSFGSASTLGRVGYYKSSAGAIKIIGWSGGNIDYTFTHEPNRWYHVCGTYSGGGWGTNTKLYIDGVEYVGTGGGGNNLSIPNNPDLDIGRVYNSSGGAAFLNGQISNFKLYDVALEASEVQKLYRLGRTGRSMVISDTAVGIGKAPEAQLDVRGTLAVRGDLFVSSPKIENLFYAPPNWGYSNTSDGEANMWSFTYNAPVDGYLILNLNAHYAYNYGNQAFYAWISVDNKNNANSTLYDNTTVGGASSDGGHFHEYSDTDVAWKDLNHNTTAYVSAGDHTISLRIRKTINQTLDINGGAIKLLFIPKNYM